MLVLYVGDHHFSSWSMRARIAVMESGVDYFERLVELDWPATSSGTGPLVAGDGDEGHEPAAACACAWSSLLEADEEGHLADSLVALMPQVPVLVDDGVVVTGAVAIGQHVDAVGGAPLFGADRRARAAITAVCNWAQNDLAALVNAAPYALSLRTTPHEVVPPAAAAQAAWVCDTIDALLRSGGGPYLVGEFSMADVMLAPVVQQLVGWHYKVNQPAVRSYVARMLERPSVARHLREARRPYDLIAAAEPGTPAWIVRHYRYNPGMQLLHDWRAGTAHRLANATARRAVELAYDGLGLADITTRLADEFSAPPALVAGDVEALFQHLRPATPHDEGHDHDRSRRAAHPPLPVA